MIEPPVSSLPVLSTDTDLVKHAETLCDAGLYLQVQPLLPALSEHPALRARLLAARARSHLGARRSADAYTTHIWRNHRGDPEAMVPYLRKLAYRDGAYRAWRFFQDHALPADAGPEQAADWCSMLAYIYGLLRDFETAQQYFDKAVGFAPDDPWVRVEWTYVCEARDEYSSAIAIAREVLQQHPGYRPAIQALAHLLTLCGQEDEALELLQRGVQIIESASLACQLLDLQFERGTYEEARRTLEYCNRYSPLAEKDFRKWATQRSADIALRLGELEQARNDAQNADSPFYTQIAERLAVPEARTRRVLLPVGFVRQNHMTCAPATLTALLRYWGHAADHLEIAEKICYDGTPYHSERKWAEEQGYLAAEFTVNWDVARSLIDAGVPFTLTTVHTASAHLQAVIGYDELRGTLLIRDPFERTHGEFDAAKLFESHRSSGPRGMLLLPREQAHRIAGITLPEADVWNSYYAVMRALQAHDRESALRVADELTARMPGHQLSINAGRALAMYDGNEPAVLATTEALLALYPDDANLQLSKASSLSLLGTREQQLAWLTQLTQLVHAKKPDPQMLIRLASRLQEDDREAKNAGRLVHSALSMMPHNASGWYELANIFWSSGKKHTGLECYRLASCLQDTNEDYASAYFRAGVLLKQQDKVLAYLRQRHARWGTRSRQPLITLFLQMEAVEQTEEAFMLLQDALVKNPDDGALILFAADAYLRYGKADKARALLGNETVAAKQASWLRAQSNLARESDEPARALELARQAVALEPLNAGLHRQIASLITQLHGKARAMEYLREVCERFNHHCGLHELLVEFLQDEPLEESEQVLRRLTGINPGNLWAQRELASNLARQQRYEEARAIVALAMQMAPTQSYNHSTLAFVCIKQGNIEEARLALRQALVLSIDNDYALSTLIGLGQALEERKETLEFILAELVRQVTLGDALLTFQSAAQTTLTPERLIEVLREALQHRPDLWQAWLALGAQLRDAGKLPEAVEHLEKSVARFPLLPRAYLELARAQRLSGDREAAQATLKAALRISPYWALLVRTYVNIVLDEGSDREPALKALDVALGRNPDNADLRALRAEVLFRAKRGDEALAELQRAIKMNPALHWPWDVLRRVARESEDDAMVERLAREITVGYPGNAWGWIRLAESAANPEEALTASGKALALDPRSEVAYETRLDILLRTRRYDELKTALDNLPWTGYVPVGVRVYAARLSRAQGWNGAASKKLRALLEEDANNYALWSEYADWCDQAGEHREYLEAAENMVRLHPNYHVAHGYYAEALCRNSQEPRARKHFERAFELDPSYAFAGLYLADRALDEADLQRAARILETLAWHSDDSVVLARNVRLSVLKEEQEAALTEAHRIFSRKDNAWASTFAIEQIDKAGWRDQLLEQIKATAAAGPCSDEATRYLIAAQGTGFFPSVYRDMKRLFKADPHHTLKIAFLIWLGGSAHKSLLDRFVKDYRQVLQSDLQSWCFAGCAYLSQERYAKAVNWMARWRERADTPAWALDNIAIALRCLGEHEQAREASLRSLALEPSNDEAQTWLALDAARLSQRQELARLLGEIDVDQIRPYYQKLVQVMRHYLDALEGGDRSKALANLRRMRGDSAVGLPAKALINELSTRLIGEYHWVLRPLLWLRQNFGRVRLA